jgi:pimeloyl-ACP methyl ester carboxylesterase
MILRNLTAYSLPAALALLVALPAAAGGGPDLAREQRLAEQTVDAILDGDPVYLTLEDDTRFLAIQMEADPGPQRGAAIILHGRGMHPDWSQVAAPLRTGLPGHGWSTLSLQMPVLEKDAKYYDYLPVFPAAVPRIEAGIRHLREQGIERIVLIAHSCSVHMSMAWIEAMGDDSISAYVGIGMGATDYQQPMPSPFPLDHIEVPLLALYGSNDYPAVHRTATLITAALPELHPASAVREIPGADHYFNDADDDLVSAVAAWLDTLDMAAAPEQGSPQRR